MDRLDWDRMVRSGGTIGVADLMEDLEFQLFCTRCEIKQISEEKSALNEDDLGFAECSKVIERLTQRRDDIRLALAGIYSAKIAK